MPAGLSLSLQLQATPTLALQKRVDMWASRFRLCKEYGMPEMIAARTKRVQRIANLPARMNFVRQNIRFFESVMYEITPFLEGVESALELFVGAGTFYRELYRRVPVMYGLELVPDIVDYLCEEMLRVEGRYVKEKLRAAPAHRILRNQRFNPTGFPTKSLDVVLAFRGFHHQPYREWKTAMRQVALVLRPGGKLIVGELFADHVPKNRDRSRGTWYRPIAMYDDHLPGFHRIHESKEILWDIDPCHVVIWQKD